jgi:hypothetical protein
MSGTVLWIMCAVIVAALAIWLTMVGLASRRPYFRHTGIERRRGRVQGSTHVGGGRSVGPHRDSPVIPGEHPEDSTLPDHAGRPGRGSGNPLDL